MLVKTTTLCSFAVIILVCLLMAVAGSGLSMFVTFGRFPVAVTGIMLDSSFTTTSNGCASLCNAAWNCMVYQHDGNSKNCETFSTFDAEPANTNINLTVYVRMVPCGGFMWIRIGTSCYFTSFDMASWDQAALFCQSNGGYLITIRNETEQYIAKFLIDLVPVYNDIVWTGGNYVTEMGFWEWFNGETWDFFPWSMGEPTGGTGEDCVAIESGSRLLWSNNNCAEEKGFICEL